MSSPPPPASGDAHAWGTGNAGAPPPRDVSRLTPGEKRRLRQLGIAEKRSARARGSLDLASWHGQLLAVAAEPGPLAAEAALLRAPPAGRAARKLLEQLARLLRFDASAVGSGDKRALLLRKAVDDDGAPTRPDAQQLAAADALISAWHAQLAGSATGELLGLSAARRAEERRGKRRQRRREAGEGGGGGGGSGGGGGGGGVGGGGDGSRRAKHYPAPQPTVPFVPARQQEGGEGGGSGGASGSDGDSTSSEEDDLSSDDEGSSDSGSASGGGDSSGSRSVGGEPAAVLHARAPSTGAPADVAALGEALGELQVRAGAARGASEQRGAGGAAPPAGHLRGEWEEHTTGFGSRLLARQGYSGGSLGRGARAALVAAAAPGPGAAVGAEGAAEAGARGAAMPAPIEPELWPGRRGLGT